MCYFAAPRKLKNAVLFVFSLIFYGWGEPRYIVLMIVSIVSGFVFALMIEKKQNKKRKEIFFGQIDKKKILCYDVFNNKKCFRRG